MVREILDFALFLREREEKPERQSIDLENRDQRAVSDKCLQKQIIPLQFNGIEIGSRSSTVPEL